MGKKLSELISDSAALLKAAKTSLSLLNRESVVRSEAQVESCGSLRLKGVQCLPTVNAEDEEVEESRDFENELHETSIDNNICTGCKMCAEICPNGSISIATEENDGFVEIISFEIRHDTCVQCGLCVKICPTNALVFGKKTFKSTREKSDLTFNLNQLLINEEK